MSGQRSFGECSFFDRHIDLPHRPIRNIITQNWVLNPTGKANAFVEIDLVQEHLNFWIKVCQFPIAGTTRAIIGFMQ